MPASGRKLGTGMQARIPVGLVMAKRFSFVASMT